MADQPTVKVTYTPKSFSILPSVDMATLEELNQAQGAIYADYMRRMEREVAAAMGIPKTILDAQSKRERTLREIMGDEYVEDAHIAPAALRYWQLIAAQY